MPYYNNLKDLPERVCDNLPEHAQEILRKVFNNAWRSIKSLRGEGENLHGRKHPLK